MSFFTSIESILPIILIIILGYVLRRSNWFADSFGNNISKLILNIVLPASIFISVQKYLTRDILFSLSSGFLYTFIAFALGYLVSWILVKILKVPLGRRGIFINAIVNANTIFIGLPLNIALFGEKSIPYFLIYYVVNTISTWALGAFLIANDDPQKNKDTQTKKFDWKKLLPPPLIGFLVSLILLLINIPIPSFVNSTLSYIGEIVTPLSLIYIGIVLADAGLQSIHFDKDTIFALIGRFIISPAIMIFVLMISSNSLGTLNILETHTLIIQSAIPALAVLPILANEAHGDVKYATNIVTTSTILFIVVIPILTYLLQYIN